MSLRTSSFVTVLLLTAAELSAASSSRIATLESYGKLPMQFEPNRGQARPESRFLARGRGYSLYLTDSGATLTATDGDKSASLRMTLRDANPRPHTEALDPLPGVSNYFIGNNPKQWRYNIPTSRRVQYRDVWPGIDLVYYGNQAELEYDFVVRAGAQPDKIRFAFDGADKLWLAENGDLVMRTPAGEVRHRKPAIYQDTPAGRRQVPGRYVLKGREVAFQLAAYDRTTTLVIDPTLVYSALIGGGTNSTYPYAIAVDSNSNAYITGYTYASDYPLANAAFSQMHTTPDAFVSKLDPTGTSLLYSSFFGGSNSDYLRGIAVDSTGAAWVTGNSYSTDFPVLNAYQSTLNTTSGPYDAVVMKLSPSGSLAYSTYLGSYTLGYGIAVDPNGNAYAAGIAYGTIPTTTGALQTSSAGVTDTFVAKFSSAGTLAYSTYLGGTSYDYGYAIAAGADGSTYVAGYSNSSTFLNAPAGGAQPAKSGNYDAFVAKLNPAGSAMSYFTFLGGTQYDYARGIAVDPAGNAVVAGYTSSTDLPTTPAALQTTSGGGLDGFVAKLNSAGSAFTYVTYLGGGRQEYLQAVAIDSTGNAYVAGQTNSSQFPTLAAIQPALPGNQSSLYQTTNVGSSWTPFDAGIHGAVYSISPDPAGSAIVATTEFGIFRSMNAGTSWTSVSTLGGAYLSRSPANSSVIYAIQCCTSVYQSTDGGANWSYKGYPSTQSNRIVADPLNANTAYSYYAQSSYPLQKTTDGGATWNPATTGLPSSTPAIYSMVAASDGSLYVDISGSGVYKSTNQGASWTNANSGSSTSAAINGLAVSASNPSILYKSVNSTYVYKTTNGGSSWTSTASAPAILGQLAVSSTNPSVVFAGTTSGFPPAMYVSTDGGSTWNASGTGLGVATFGQVVADPSNGAYAYALVNTSTAAFAAKINPTGTALVYSTYLGGTGYTYGYGIAANNAGDAFVVGYNYGAFPVTSTALQSNVNQYQAFVVRISDATPLCTFAVNPAALTVNSSVQMQNYAVTAASACPWSATSNQSWASIVSGAAGTGSGSFSVTLTLNTTGAARTATISVANQSVSIIQIPSSCTYTLSTSSFTLPASGGTVQASLNTGAGCPWTVNNNYPFAASIVSAASGTGNGTVTINVAASPLQTPRTLSFSIGTTSLSVTQAGYCSYAFSPSSIVLSGSGGSGTVTVTTPAGCGWTAISNNTTFLTITAGSAGIGNGSFSYTATANTGTNRTTSISIGGTSIPVTQTLGQAYIISTLAAGIMEPFTSTLAANVSISGANALAVDSSGSVYFTSANLHSVFKADAYGTVTRLAGTGVSGFTGDGGPAINAQVNNPNGIAVDALGNIFFADTSNQRIRKISTSGIITTVAGNGACCYLSDGVPATTTYLNNPQGVALDRVGNLYIADTNNHRIRKVDTNGIITTVAGTGSSGYSGDGGAAISAQINSPNGITVDAQGNLFIADTNNQRIRKVDTNGSITTMAGKGSCCYSGDGGPATSAQINTPIGLALDAAGNLYIADSNSPSIRKVAVDGTISSFAGNGSWGFAGDGGPASGAVLANPRGVAVDTAGNVYFTDVNNQRIRKVSSGTITTLVGGYTGDTGLGLFASLNQSKGAVRDSGGNIYIADTWNHRIRKVAANGTITTIAGTGISGYSGDNGPATSALLNQPNGLALDSANNLYVAEYANRRVRKIAANGTITTLAGTGNCCFSGDNGLATNAALNSPQGLAVDTAGNVYIADAGNSTVRKVAVSGIITTIAGTSASGYSGDNGPATSAQLNSPEGVAVDAAGNLYIADTNNHRIRKVAANGIITTVAGSGACCFSGDSGLATGAQFYYPQAVAVDSGGNLYIADTSNNRIRKVDTSGIISTIAGNGNSNYTGDGGPATSATLRSPSSLFVDSTGNVYVSDTNNNALRLLTPAGVAPVLSVQMTHTGTFAQGQAGAQYTVTVTNAGGAAATSGTVAATAVFPGLTLASMTGSGWLCSSGLCSRSDALTAGSSYPPIAITVNVDPYAATQVTSLAFVTNGAVPVDGTSDFTLITAASAPAPFVLDSPSDGASGVSLTPALSWYVSARATSYDVHFGTTTPPPTVATTTNTNYLPGTLSSSVTYYWSVTANNSAGSTASAIRSFAASCISPLGQSNITVGSSAGTGTVIVTAAPGCPWSAQSNAAWLFITGGTPGNGNGGVNYSVAANPGLLRVGTLTVAGQTFTVTQSGSAFASQTYLISTFAGGAIAPTVGPGASVSMPVSYGLAADANGNLYFPAPNLNAVFKADVNGVVTRIAGTGTPGFSGDGGSALSAQLNFPNGVALDSAGNVYFADTNNRRIRKIAANGIITTVAGNGGCCYSGDGGAATSAYLSYPLGIAVDSLGAIYFADANANRVRKISGGIISTVAGNGTYGSSGDTGQATSATLRYPNAVAVDISGNLYIADTDSSRIRKVDSYGVITTVAGTGTPAYSGDGGAATSAQLNSPQGLAVDAAGNLYIADANNQRVRKVGLNGAIATVAGSGAFGYGGDGGPATSALISIPQGLAVDGASNLYIADSANQRIRKVLVGGIISTLVGGSTGDTGPAAFGGLNSPFGMVRDVAGNTFIADSYNHRIRKIASDGTITTLAGTGANGYSGDSGSAAGAQLNQPRNVAVDASGNVYLSDPNNARIRKVAPNGTITTVAGNGNWGYTGDGAQATAAQLNYPWGLASDAAGNLYITETFNHTVRRVAANGVITTLAGTGSSGYSGDTALATTAKLNSPNGVAVDATGNVYIADSYNYRIRKISAATGIITTVAGIGNCCYSGDGGPAVNAQLNYPTGVAVDPAGNLYIADQRNHRIRKVDLNGTITTIAGNGTSAYSGDGGLAASGTFRNPVNVFSDSSGSIYVTDMGNNAIRLLTPLGTQPVLTLQSTHSGNFSQGQTAAAYTLTVGNVASSWPTSGTVTVTELLPTGFTLASMSGTGWTCAANTCTRADTLAPGQTYPTIAAAVNVSATAPSQLVNRVLVSGGGSTGGIGASDLTVIQSTAPVLTIAKTHTGNFGPGQTNATYTVTVSNQTGATSTTGTVTVTETIPTGLTLVSMSGSGWTCAANTCTRSDALPGGSSYAPITVTVNVANNAASLVVNAVAVSGGGAASASASDSTTVSCAYQVSGNGTYGSSPATGVIGIATTAGCPWTASTATSWLHLTSATSGTGAAQVNYSLDLNLTIAQRTGTITVAGQTVTIIQGANVAPPNAGLRFVPITPCRVADTRIGTGAYGGPSLAAATPRDFNITGSTCSIPANAQAYSLNLTVVPLGTLGFLSVWPAGQPQPVVSTLNAPDGRVKANAAIVPAGTGGSITLFASNATNAIIDINGYFVPVSGNNDLAFYPLTPCRIADTRIGTGTFAGPALTGGVERSFPVLSSTCGIPANARAYALNMTVVPTGPLGFLSAWPSGSAQPGASTLNAPTGAVTANAAIIPAGAGGAISLITTNTTHVIIDINGYFAPPGPGGMQFYSATPCRILDTRGAIGPFGGPQLAASTPREFTVAASTCGIPANAGAYSLNATVVPPAALGFLTLWGAGGQPTVSTLNAGDGSIVANAAIVPASATGSVSAIASNATHLILDINGYFAR